VAAAVHATGLAEALQAARERLVTAREEERRRVRRDLHDGLGPALTGLAFSADAATNLVREDPDAAVRLLDDVRREIRVALGDVRRLVDDLRPDAVDELGLVGALRRRAEQLSRRVDGQPLRVRLDLPDPPPELPAAVEVATYRIVSEALTNVARHAAATSAVVRIRCGERLELAVLDDGPSDGGWRGGVGLQAMSERAAELGGRLVVGPTPDGGRVRASIPLSPR
jgi:two-component system, NarL family, sensor kinase